MRKIKGWSLIWLALNCIVIVLFLLVCLVPFVRGGIGWFLSMLGMFFPYLVLAMILFLLSALLAFRNSVFRFFFLVNLVVLLLGYQQIRAVLGFHFLADHQAEDRSGDIRVMVWNVSSWDVNNWDIKGGHTFQPLMFDLIDQAAPDVLMLQEFFNCTDPTILESYVTALKGRGFPYYYFAPSSYTVEGKFQSGLAIFSKQPVGDTAFVKPATLGHSEGFQYADIAFNGKKYRFFNWHLESPGMNSDDVGNIGKIEGAKTLFYKLKTTHAVRMSQATILKEMMDKSPYPVIAGGDLDDIPNSTAYFFLRKNLKDAFKEKGSGIGRTFHYVSPTLRIDYLFIDPGLSVNRFAILDGKYSAHYPLVIDLTQ